MAILNANSVRYDADAPDTIPSASNSVDKPIIRNEFSKNAGNYDAVAVVQRRIADRLIETVLEVQGDIDANGTFQVLDAGAGTGYVGRTLSQQLTAIMQKSLVEQSKVETSPEVEKHNSTIIPFTAPVTTKPSTALIAPKVTALDLSPEMLEVAKTQGGYDAYIAGDIEALPCEDKTFDLVVSSLAIQWCHDITQALKELHRVTKSGGRISIATIIEGTLRELESAFKTIDNEQHILAFLTEEKLKAEVTALGGSLTIYEEIVTFDSLKSLFKSLKHIGATSLPNRRKGLLGRSSIAKLEQYFASIGGYQLTYVVALIDIPKRC